MLIRAAQPACFALRAPDRSSDVWDAGSPEFVHHWLVKTPAQFLPSCSQCARRWILTQALNKLIFTIRRKWTNTRAHVNKDTQTGMHEMCALSDKCSAVCRSCCLICKTQLSKAGAKQAIRGSSSWALDCIPLTFTQWFMSKDLSPSQWGLHTELFRNTQWGKRRVKKLTILLWGSWNLYNSQLSKLLAACAGLLSVCKTHKIATVPLKSV